MNIKRLYNSDESILEGIKASDDAALSYLYKISYPIIRNLILKNSGTEDDIDDILQEGIIVLYEKAKSDSFKITCLITTFIYSVCRNQWLKTLKKRRLNVSFMEIQETAEIANDSIDEEHVMNEQQKTLVEALKELGDPCRSILTHFYYEQFSMEKIAEMLNYTNADNAKNKKYKCLKRIRKIMIEKMKGYLLE